MPQFFKITLCFLLCLCGIGAYSQDCTSAKAFFEKADSNVHSDSVIYYIEKARPDLIACELWDTVLYTYCLSFHHYYKAIDFKRTNLAIEEGAYLLDKPMKDSMALVYYFNNNGILNQWKGDNLSALQYFEKALNLYDSLFYRHPSYEFTANNNLGLRCKKVGDFELASSYYSKAYNLLEIDTVFSADVSLSNQRIREATLLYNHAQVLVNTKKNETANELLQKGLAILKPSSINKVETISYVTILYSLAYNYLETNQLDSALHFLNKTYDYSSTTLQKAERFQLSGKLNLATKDYKAALNNFHRARDIYLLEDSERSSIMAQINRDLAHCYQAMNQHKPMRKHYQLAIDALNKNRMIINDWKNPPSIESIPDKLNLLYILSDKAAYLLASAGQDVNQLREALAHYSTIAQLEDVLRSNYQSEQAKLFLANRSNAYFEKAISTAYELHQLTNESQYLEAAFFFSEKSKALVLLDEIKSKELTSQSLLPDSLVERKYKLRSQKKLFQIQLARAKKKKKTDPIEIARLEDELFEATQDEIALQKQIAQEEPTYLALTETRLMTIADVQTELLSEGELMLSYFEGMEQSFVIAIGQDHISLDTLDRSVKESIQDLLNNQKMFEQGYAAVAYALYQKLIPNYTQQQAKKLILIPDGSIAYLSFDMLLTEEASTLLPKQMDWLLYKYATQYAYSASTLAIQSKKQKEKVEILALAPVFEGSTDFLPFSLTEMEVLQGFAHQPLYNENATFAQFGDLAPDYGVLHLSTHATAADPETQQPSIRFIDRTVALNDIYTLRLSAQLAILSACETNTGTYQKGEGVMSISRGFAYAGVPSLCTTLWAVNDESTAQVIQDYYKHLAEGSSKSTALQQAKIDYLNSCAPDRAAPYYWAAFVSIGNDHPVYLTEATVPYYLYLLGIGLIGLMAFLWFKKGH